MLQVELRALEGGPVDVERSVSIAELGFVEADPVMVGPVRVAGRLTQAGTGQYFWRGRLQATAQLDCRRCLTQVTPALDVPVEVLFVENGEADDAGVYALPADSAVLDLTGMVREELVLATPEWVLCTEECKGLCAGCGTDLNNGSCECAPATDPRWAVLQALKTDLADEDS